MAPRLVLALCALLVPLVMSPDASANGRSPGTSTIHFRHGAEQEVVAGMSFGLLLTRDNGASWYWMCEEAIGYGGTYDPDYEFTSSGALFATTFTGLKVARDACTFQAPNGMKFVSAIAQAPDGTLYYGAADAPSATSPGDAKIYRSIDDGMTWTPGSAMPGMPGDWWQSLEIAPSSQSRLYLAGYRFTTSPTGNVKTFLLFRSDNAGDTWQALPTTDFMTMPNSTIEIAGISYTNPDLVYARVKLEDNSISDAIYRSTDAGMTWTRILGKAGSIAFVVRRSGELVAATQALGAARSTNNGDTWIDLASPPHINCLAENSAREVWACTQNYGGMGAQSDGYGIMKSTDLATWSGVLKYQEIKAPIACADGTVQKDRCDTQLWCGLCAQLGCVSGRPECAPAGDPPTTGGGGDKGCCRTSAAPAPGAMLLVIAVGVLLLRRRRRR
jgi:MYXO-CTERM domain-containing protein